jgi:hypothetical protein
VRKRARLPYTPAVTTLLKLGHGRPGVVKLLRRSGFEIFMPHPAIVDRAEVLEVRLPGEIEEAHLRVRELSRT